jgi:hypothetical protein
MRQARRRPFEVMRCWLRPISRRSVNQYHHQHGLTGRFETFAPHASVHRRACLSVSLAKDEVGKQGIVALPYRPGHRTATMEGRLPLFEFTSAQAHHNGRCSAGIRNYSRPCPLHPGWWSRKLNVPTAGSTSPASAMFGPGTVKS